MNIFITGVSSGVGRALVKQLIRDGHTVWGIARRQELLENLHVEVASDRFFFSVCDIANYEDVRRVRAEMNQKRFSPDVAVLNAAVFETDAVPHFDIAAFERVMRTNVCGALVWVDAFIEEFLQRGSGQFIAISSIAAFRPDPAHVAYPASKSALTMAFRSLKAGYQTSNVFFTTIFFGPLATDMSVHVRRDTLGRIVGKNFLAGDPEQAARIVIRAMHKKKSCYFFPFFATTLFRITRFLPDAAFVFLSRKLKQK